MAAARSGPIFPWASAKEWQQVCHDLFSGDTEKMKRSCAHIRSWIARSTSSMAFPIESTSDIIECLLLQETLATQDLCSDHVLRLAYAMAVNRFVNGVYEFGYAEGHRGSIVDVAGKVGVPPWVVEARHAAAHGLLPHMSTFRACMDFGLQWLKVRYWDVMIVRMEEKGKDNLPREVAGSRESLTGVIEIMWKDIQKGKQLSSCNKFMVRKLQELEAKDLAGLLQETSFLRLSSVQPRSLEDVRKLMTALPNSSKSGDILCELPRIPRSSLTPWLGVLQSASSANACFLTNLVAALICSMHQQSIAAMELLRYGSWIRFLLMEWVVPKAPSSIKWCDLLPVVKDNPGPFSAGIMKAILQHTSDRGTAHSAVGRKLLEAAELVSISERIGVITDGDHVIKIDGQEPYLQECISLLEKVRKRHVDSHSSASARKKFQTCSEIKDWKGHTQQLKVVPALDLPRRLDQTNWPQLTKTQKQHEQSVAQLLVDETSETAISSITPATLPGHFAVDDQAHCQALSTAGLSVEHIRTNLKLL